MRKYPYPTTKLAKYSFATTALLIFNRNRLNARSPKSQLIGLPIAGPGLAVRNEEESGLARVGTGEARPTAIVVSEAILKAPRRSFSASRGVSGL